MLEQRVIADLYDGTLDDDAWRRAMEGAADLVRGVCTCLFAFNPLDGRILRQDSWRFDPKLTADYCDNWAPRDPRMGPALRFAVAEPIVDVQVMELRQWQRTEFCGEFLQPNDIPWFLCAWLHKAPDKLVCVSIEGSRRRGPFEAGDARRLKPVLAHMSRALRIRDRLETHAVREKSLERTMESTRFGVLLLDDAGRMLEANGIAARLLADRDSIQRRPDGTIWLRDPAGRELARWLAEGSTPSSAGDGLLHVPRRAGQALTVLVARLPVARTGWVSSRLPQWLLLLFDPELQVTASMEWIARDLKITEREAQIVILIHSGESPARIAERLSISLATVRSHLKSIYRKTGLDSQAALVRRLSAGPLMPAGRAVL